MSAPIIFNFAGLPGGSAYCFTSYSRFALDIAAGMSGSLVGAYSTFNYGSTQPAVDDQNKPWFNTNDGQWYFFDSGIWVRPHPTPPGGDERRLWVGSQSDLWSYDGGDGSDPATTTPTGAVGAMWQVDATPAARIPLFPGTLPGGTVVNVGSTGGSEQKTLGLTEMPPHTHTFDLEQDGTSGSIVWPAKTGGAATPHYVDGATTKSAGGTGSPAAAAAFSLMNPYYGIFLIKRTGRVYITA